MSTRSPNLDLTSINLGGLTRAPAGPLVGARGKEWWTGLCPDDAACPGRGKDGYLRALPIPDLRTCSREQVLAYFQNGWALTELLFSALQGDDAFMVPAYHRLRHPLVFYLGHPAVLYVNKLRVAGLLGAPLNPLYEQLFETGVDEMSWDEMSKNDMVWPRIDEVLAYRRRVYELVCGLIRDLPALDPGHAPITMDMPEWALFLSFEHERIHVETSSVLMRESPLSTLRRPERFPPLHPSVPKQAPPQVPVAGRDFPAPELVVVEAGSARVGKPRDFPTFGWDNEYGQDERPVRGFRAGRRLVSNGEFYAFVVGGGYAEQRFWSEAGWRWRKGRNAHWPTFWVSSGPAGLHQYQLRTIFEVVPMPWSWPAEVNAHEAAAYCNWLTEKESAAAPYRLLTEGEHHRIRAVNAAKQAPVNAAAEPADHAMAASGNEVVERFGFNLALAYSSPSPVDGPSADGGAAKAAGEFRDVFGNVWQWLGDDFHPLKGFKIHPYYYDFSTPCFDGEHSMIMGGSFISCGDEASAYARFHFRPHFFQHAGFRVAASAEGGAPTDAVRLHTSSATTYETERALGEYLLMHFGDPAEQLPYQFGPHSSLGFPQRLSRRLIQAAQQHGVPTRRALDVGCAVGGSSFELALQYPEVLGVDLSASFIDAANALRSKGELPYRRKDEGDLLVEGVARIPAGVDRERTAFRRADACSLPPELVGYDAVLLANLLCRLPSPHSLLGRLSGPRGLVAPGGLLLIASPFSWLEEYTPREAWLGGREVGGKVVRSRDALLGILAEAGFDLLEEADEPLLIREHNRKYQFIISHVGVWRRRPE